MGLCRDDEEDLAGDAEELLGSNAAIDLDADIPAHLEGQSSQPAGSESVNTSSRKRRASTSKVWNDFDEIYEVITGKLVLNVIIARKISVVNRPMVLAT